MLMNGSSASRRPGWAMDGPTSGRVRGNRTSTRGEPGLNLRTRTQKVNGICEEEVKEAQDGGQNTALGDTASVASGSAPNGSGVDRFRPEG